MSELVKLVEYLHNNWSVLWNGRFPFGMVLLLVGVIFWKWHHYRVKKVEEALISKFQARALTIPSLPTVSPAPVESAVKLAEPNLVCTGIKQIAIGAEPGNVFHESETHRENSDALVAVINNRAGKETIDAAYTVRAQVIYRSVDGAEKFHGTTSWLDSFGNAVDFEIGSTHTLVLLLLRADKGALAVLNSNQQSLPHHARSAMHALETSAVDPRPVVLPLDGEVVLFDARGKTLLKFNVDMRWEADGTLSHSLLTSISNYNR